MRSDPMRAVPPNSRVRSDQTRPLPPKGTGLNGKTLWSALLDRYEFEPHEIALLREMVRCVDDLDRLASAVSRQGTVTPGGNLNPAFAEARQLRIALAALVGALHLPAEHEDDGPAPVRRPRRYAPVRHIDQPAPRTEADPRAVAHGRHSTEDPSPGKAAGVSVAELCTKVGGRAAVQRVV